MSTRHLILTLRFIHARRSSVEHAKMDPVFKQDCKEDGFTEGGKLVQFAIAQYTAVSTCDTTSHECGQSIETKEQRKLGVPVRPIPKRAKAFSWSHVSSISYSDIGPTASSHGVPSCSSAGSKPSHCPACNACDSIYQGCCQVCGYERPRNPTPLRRAWQYPNVTPKQPLWVPFKHVKDQQEIAFAMSELKFRYFLCLLF